MKCGHPLAARAIRVTKTGELVTVCWACEVETELARAKKAA